VSCPAAEAIPAESAAEIVRDAAGTTLPSLFPGATFTRRVQGDAQVLLAEVPGPVTVEVVAPEPLKVSLTIDPGPCVALTRMEHTGVAQVAGVTVTVRNGDQELAAWKLGKTRIEAPWPKKLVVQTPSGPVAFDTAGEGLETLRTLVQVPELRPVLASAPDLVVRLGPLAPGVAQEALRKRDGGAGDGALAGARILAGPGVKGATVWVDGLPLGKIGHSLTAPVGGLVKIRWEGVAEGGVEAVIGPGVDVELRADGRARVVTRPKGTACARRADGEPLSVCFGNLWVSGDAFSMTDNACAPDGGVTVTAGPLPGPGTGGPDGVPAYWSNPKLPARTIWAGLPGDYTFTPSADGLQVKWAPPGEEKRCGITVQDNPRWDRDLTGHALGSAAEDYAGLFAAQPWLAPLGEAYSVHGLSRNHLAFEKPVRVALPFGGKLRFGADGQWTANPISRWDGDSDGTVQIDGPFVLESGAMAIDVWDAELYVSDDVLTIRGRAWYVGKLCDGTFVTAKDALVDEEYLPDPSAPAPGPGPHVVKVMGVDAVGKELWFVVEPAPDWPLVMPGLPRPAWTADLSTRDERLVRCPL
jgi:hypothetical protein